MISNNEGQLLMYGNGCTISDSTFDVIENGYGINDISADAFEDCYQFPVLGHRGWMQDCLFIPCDDTDSCFLYIYKPRNKYAPNTTPVDKIALAKIIKKDDGKYKVITKDSVFYNEPNTVSGLNLLKKKDSNHWWLTSATDSINSLLVFEVNGSDITLKKRQYFNNIVQDRQSSVSSKFSAQGDLYAVYDVPFTAPTVGYACFPLIGL